MVRVVIKWYSYGSQVYIPLLYEPSMIFVYRIAGYFRGLHANRISRI